MNYKKLLSPSQTDLNGYSYTKRVGGYLISTQLGKGAFAVVNEGMHSSTGEKVAIKIIDKQLCQKDNYVKKHLHREGKIMQKLNHPNIIQLLEIMETENSYYLIMELCTGNLMSKIIMKTYLTEAETKLFMKQLIIAVDYLHKCFIMHRDLKVENILLTNDDILKLTDFGISIQLNPNNSLALSSLYSKNSQLFKTQCGSPAYAAPEVLSKTYYNYSADIWSIGINMFAMLTGTLPFTVKPFNLEKLRDKMMNREMNSLPDSISTECTELMLKFLEPHSDKRISLSAALNDPWIISGQTNSLIQLSHHKIQSIPINSILIKHMEENLDFLKTDIIKSILEHTPTSAFATYNLLLKKVSKRTTVEKIPLKYSFNKLLRKNEKPMISLSFKPIKCSEPLNEITNSPAVDPIDKSKHLNYYNSFNSNNIPKYVKNYPGLLTTNSKSNDNPTLLNIRQKINMNYNKSKTSLDWKNTSQSEKYNLINLGSQALGGYNSSYLSHLNHTRIRKSSFSQLPQPYNVQNKRETRRLSVMEEIWRMPRNKLERNVSSIESNDYLKSDQIIKRY